jgi:hypothetical protein
MVNGGSKIGIASSTVLSLHYMSECIVPAWHHSFEFHFQMLLKWILLQSHEIQMCLLHSFNVTYMVSQQSLMLVSNYPETNKQVNVTGDLKQ